MLNINTKYERRKASTKYREGDLFTIPLIGGGCALGMIIRKRRADHKFVGSIFGPKRLLNKAALNVIFAENKNCLFTAIIDDSFLVNARWFLFRRLGLNKAEWPLPIFYIDCGVSNIQSGLFPPNLRACVSKNTKKFLLIRVSSNDFMNIESISEEDELPNGAVSYEVMGCSEVENMSANVIKLDYGFMPNIEYFVGDVFLIPVGMTKFVPGVILGKSRKNDSVLVFISKTPISRECVFDISQLMESNHLMYADVTDHYLRSGRWKIIPHGGEIDCDKWTTPKMVRATFKDNMLSNGSYSIKYRIATVSDKDYRRTTSEEITSVLPDKCFAESGWGAVIFEQLICEKLATVKAN